MKNKKKLKFLVLLGIMSTSMFQSCTKDENIYAEENVNSQQIIEDEGVNFQRITENEIVKDFEIKPEWFQNFNTNKSVNIDDNTYNNFGLCYNQVTNKYTNTFIRKAGVSMKPIIETVNPQEHFKYIYTATTNLSELNTKTQNNIKANTGASVGKLTVNASASSESFVNIKNKEKSVYVSMVYLLHYGTAILRNDIVNIDEYLKWSTVSNGSETDPYSFNLNTQSFRNNYGDKFIKEITIGCIYQVILEISNVDFSKDTKENIEADAKAVLGGIQAGGSWSNLKETNEAFSSSSIVVEGHGAPSGPVVTQESEIKPACDHMLNLYESDSQGIISILHANFSTFYPKFQFFPTDYYFTKGDIYNSLIDKWQALKFSISHSRGVKLRPVTADLTQDIADFTIYRDACYLLQSAPYPIQSYYDARYNEYINRIKN